MSFDFIAPREVHRGGHLRAVQATVVDPARAVSATGDPRPGVEARVHDPLWFIGRQWQLGEFEGEDAGTPLTVRVVTTTTQVDRWAPGLDGVPQPLDRDSQDLLEPLGGARAGRSRRGRAGPSAPRRGRVRAAGGPRRRRPRRPPAPSLVTQCPLDTDPAHHPDGGHVGLDPVWTRLERLLGNSGLADGELVAAALESAAPDLPGWLVPADDAERDALRAVLDPWLAWYRAEVSPLPGGTDAWLGSRLRVPLPDRHPGPDVRRPRARRR